MAKFRRLAGESAKQCGRNFVMEIDGPVALVDFLGRTGDGNVEFLWMHPGAAASAFEWASNAAALKAIPDRAAGKPGEESGIYAPAVLIGPEGGWSDAEATLLSDNRHVHPVRLTATVLRMETAAVVAAAVICCAAGC